MYKLRSKPGRRKNMGYGRVAAKRQKTEGNTNITSNRVTVSPGFLRLGVKSETVKRNPGAENIYRERDLILNEDLEGLLQSGTKDNFALLRRSARLSKNRSADSIARNTSESAHYRETLEAVATPTLISPELEQNLDSPLESLDDSDSKNISRSIFHEINERYAKYERNVSLNSSRGSRINSHFCSKLLNQVCVGSQLEAATDCKKRIIEMTENINRLITGRSTNNFETEMKPMSKNYTNEKFEKDYKFEYLPRSLWVYATPPKQRLQTPKLVDGDTIEPAVIYTTKKHSTIYELKPNVHIDMTLFENKQPIPLNHNYVQCAGEFVHQQSQKNDYEQYRDTSGSSREYDDNFNFLKPLPRLPVANTPHLITRPRKTVERVSRIGMLKQDFKFPYPKYQSRSTNTSSTANLSPFMGSFTTNSSPTFPSSSSQEDGDYGKSPTFRESKFRLDFKRSLFESQQEDGMFSLNNNNNNESPKKFDFSKLRTTD